MDCSKNTDQQHKKKIIIFEDNINILKYIENALSEQGFEAFAYTNGINYRQNIKNVNPDIILLDIKMPGISGNEIAKNIRMQDTETPILFISSYAPKYNLMNQYSIIKPFNKKILLNKISSILKSL